MNYLCVRGGHLMSPMASKCSDIGRRLSNAKKKLNSVLAECAEDFSDLCVDEREMSDECFELLIAVLCQKRFRRCGAIAHWLTDLVVEKEKLLRTDQKTRLLEALLDSHQGYQRQIALHAVGDVIARLYEPDDAISALRKIVSMRHPSSNYVAQVAAEIILVQVGSDHPFHSEVRSLFLTPKEGYK